MKKQFDIHHLPGKLILFDGVCNLCNQSVQFILKKDKQQIFCFASLQSDLGQSILKEHNMPLDNFNSFVYIEEGIVFTQSEAALRLSKHLSGIIRYAYYLRIIPRFIRNGVYRLISKFRYKIWGKMDACTLPTPEIKTRFID